MVLIHNQLRVLWCDNISVTVTLTPETARLHCDSLADYVTVIEYHTLHLHRHVRLVVSFSIFFDNHTHTHTHTHVSMADTRLPRPTMDWSASDCAQALHDFQQLCKMWFTVNQTAYALQHNYIMLWLGNEGLRLLNSWSLMADQLQDPKNIWDRLALLEPSQNFRIHRLEMQRMCQKQGESVEDFYIRIKTQALKCEYASEDVTQERILEQLIAGTTIQKVQRELLSKDDTLTIAQALDIVKAHEASIKHMRQIQDLTLSPSTIEPQAVWKLWRHSCPRKCPAYGPTCSRCHKKNHWRQARRSGSSRTANAGGGQAAHAKAPTKPTRRRGWSLRRPGHRRQAIHTVTDDSD